MLSARAAIRDVTWALRWGTSRDWDWNRLTKLLLDKYIYIYKYLLNNALLFSFSYPWHRICTFFTSNMRPTDPLAYEPVGSYIDRPGSCATRPCTRPITRKLTLTEMIYRPIGASPDGLPAGEATPSRQSYADCGRGTPGGRLPRRPGSIYTVHPTAAQTGILFSRSPRSLLQRFPLCTVVYLRLKVSLTGFSLGKLWEKRLTV